MISGKMPFEPTIIWIKKRRDRMDRNGKNIGYIESGYDTKDMLEVISESVIYGIDGRENCRVQISIIETEKSRACKSMGLLCFRRSCEAIWKVLNYYEKAY